MTTNIYADLPEVVEILHLEDAGEGGAGTCPHCGAIGRYIYWFETVGGEMHGAMKGCFKHFPKSRYFERMAAILSKEKDFAKKGWKLAGWDQDVLNAIRAYSNNTMTQEQVDDVIRNADRAKNAYMKRKGYR